ncbi:hypothetical protein PISMIDRAFT_11860, partial [Pisolithus microcarpus 441]
MAPRKQKGESAKGGGAKTGESSSKKTKVRDTLLADTRPGSGPQLEKEIEEANAMNEQVKKALLGYARFDILQNCDVLKFGKWNPRQLLPSQVAALGNSFLINGVDRFNYSYAMPLVMDKSSIEEGSYMPTPDAGPNLPELKLRDGLPKDFKITAAGGQHRVAALKDWYAKKKAQLEECIKEQQAILSADVETLADGDLKKMNTTHKLDRQELESILAYGGQWLVVLYDKSKITNLLALYLSRNETKHVYMESPMEGLIQVYKIISAVDRDFKDVSTIAHVKGNPAKQRELLRLDYVWDMMSFFDAAGTHYWHSDIMKFKEFYNTMTSSYGGILAFLIRKLEKRLYYCFNSVQLDPYEVQEAIEAIEHDSEDIESRKRLGAIYIKLRNATPIPGAISSGMRNIFDEAFCTSILKTSAIDYFGNSTSPQWVTAYAQYTDSVPNKLRELVEKMENRGDLDSEVTDIGIALRSCAVKAQIVFACDSFRRELPFFPFMTSSAIIAVSKHLSKIDSALVEVCLRLSLAFCAFLTSSEMRDRDMFTIVSQFSSWWSPYIYSAKVFPREWSPGSPTADMIRAIMAHPSIMPKKRMNVCDEVISAIFNHYPAFVNMVSSLSRITVPPRFVKQSELLAVFGTQSVSSSTKGKGKASSDESEDGEYIPNDDDDDDESNPDADEDDKEPQTDAPQTNERRDQRAVLRQKKKDDSANRMNSLKREIQDAVTILAASAKGHPIPTVPLYQPWTRTSCLSSGITANLFRGQNLVQWHTWEWASVSSPSRSRNLRILACASVVEHVVIAHYRPLLLADSKSGACFLRNLVEDFTHEYRVRINVPTIQQSTLDNNLQLNKAGIGKVSLVWPDNIDAPPPETSSFDLSREIARFNEDSLRSSQQTQIQKIVYHVESSRIAWQDTTNTAVLRDKPSLAPNILLRAPEGLGPEASPQPRKRLSEASPHMDGSVSLEASLGSVSQPWKRLLEASWKRLLEASHSHGSVLEA